MLTPIGITPGHANDYPTNYHYKHQPAYQSQKRARPAYFNHDHALAKRARYVSPHDFTRSFHTSVAREDAEAIREAVWENPRIITYVGKGKARAIDVPESPVPRIRRNPSKLAKNTVQGAAHVSKPSTSVNDMVMGEIPAEPSLNTHDAVMYDADINRPGTSFAGPRSNTDDTVMYDADTTRPDTSFAALGPRSQHRTHQRASKDVLYAHSDTHFEGDDDDDHDGNDDDCPMTLPDNEGKNGWYAAYSSGGQDTGPYLLVRNILT